jgi:hypothetical protein
VTELTPGILLRTLGTWKKPDFSFFSSTTGAAGGGGGLPSM